VRSNRADDSVPDSVAVGPRTSPSSAKSRTISSPTAACLIRTASSSASFPSSSVPPPPLPLPPSGSLGAPLPLLLLSRRSRHATASLRAASPYSWPVRTSVRVLAPIPCSSSPRICAVRHSRSTKLAKYGESAVKLFRTWLGSSLRAAVEAAAAAAEAAGGGGVVRRAAPSGAVGVGGCAG
jgi:hypothetical protein